MSRSLAHILLLTALLTPARAGALSLIEAMERAAANTEAAALLETDVAAAEAVERTALGELLPLLRLTGQSVRNQEEIRLGDSVFVNLWDHGANIRLSLDIFRGTSIPTWVSAQRSADAVALRARWEVAGLRLAAARAYLAALTARGNLEAAEESVVLRQTSLEQSQLLVDAGYGTGSDISLARFSLIEAETAVVNAQQSLDNALDTLRFVVNLDDLTVADLVEPSLTGDLVVDRVPTVDQLLEDRDDIRALRVEVAAREAATLAQWLTFFPTLSVAGQYNIGPESLRAPDGTYWTITLAATWDLFDYRRYGRIDGAEAGEEAAQLQLDEAARALETDLATAVRRVEAATERLRLAQLAVEAAAETRTLEADRHAAGDATSLELVSADVALFRAQVSGNVARLERDLSVVELAYLIGQLEYDSWPSR